MLILGLKIKACKQKIANHSKHLFGLHVDKKDAKQTQKEILQFAPILVNAFPLPIIIQLNISNKLKQSGPMKRL